MALTYKTSKTGRYSVELSAAFPRNGFTYKPGRDITVTQTVLDDMIAAEVVTSVVAAD